MEGKTNVWRACCCDCIRQDIVVFLWCRSKFGRCFFIVLSYLAIPNTNFLYMRLEILHCNYFSHTLWIFYNQLFFFFLILSFIFFVGLIHRDSSYMYQVVPYTNFLWIKKKWYTQVTVMYTIPWCVAVVKSRLYNQLLSIRSDVDYTWKKLLLCLVKYIKIIRNNLFMLWDLRLSRCWRWRLIFWHMTPCSLVNILPSFLGISSFFKIEAECHWFLLNVGCSLPNCSVMSQIAVVLTHLHYTLLKVPFFLWRNSPNRADAASFLRFLDHTQLHTTGRTPLNEWSARPRGHYLHNTQQTTNKTDEYPYPQRDSNPRSQRSTVCRTVGLPPGPCTEIMTLCIYKYKPVLIIMFLLIGRPL
jgi:hypothetical protein